MEESIKIELSEKKSKMKQYSNKLSQLRRSL